MDFMMCIHSGSTTYRAYGGLILAWYGVILAGYGAIAAGANTNYYTGTNCWNMTQKQ